MKEGNEIAKIIFKIDPGQLRKISNSGRLEEFVEKATKLFRRDLKTELVTQTASSVNTALFWEDDEFGTGPRPPYWHNIAKIEDLVIKVSALEELVVGLGKGRVGVGR